jgi:dimethylglycine dehydrogenase
MIMCGVKSRRFKKRLAVLRLPIFPNMNLKGWGLRAYLDRILAGYVPAPGRLTLTPMLTPKGKLYGDLTVACLADDHFMLFGSGAMQQAHRRWFEKDLPDDVDLSQSVG